MGVKVEKSALMCVEYRALLHLFYVVSPARSGIIKQTYGSESAGDRVKKGIVYIHLVVALVAQALWCASIVFSIQGKHLRDAMYFK